MEKFITKSILTNSIMQNLFVGVFMELIFYYTLDIVFFSSNFIIY